MIKIDFAYLKNWKWGKQFDDVYQKQVNIVGKLDKSLLIQDDTEIYNYFQNYGNEDGYIYLTDINNPDKYNPIFIGDSLKVLLEKNGYIDYDGNIRIFGDFAIMPTTKSNIGNVWKVDILDKYNNIIETIKKED